MTRPDAPASTERPERPAESPRRGRDRSLAALLYYRATQTTARFFFVFFGGFRATGQEHVPESGAALMVCNHLSFWDVFIIGTGCRRPLNFMARSTLFKPVLGTLIRWMGTFPIQREGIGVQGFKETLRRLKRGGIVVLFPEGTRSPDGKLQELKPGIAPLAVKSRVPVIPAGIAGTFESWPRHRKFPRPHPMRIHYGPPISPEELAALPTEQATALIRDRLSQAIEVARLDLKRDACRPPSDG